MTKHNRTLLIGSPTRAINIPIEPRVLFNWVALALCAIGIGIIKLCSGVLPFTPLEVVNALLGQAPLNVQTIVVDWRLPRVVYGLLFGAALGVSGALFQSMVRNPLGSPDVIGFGSGAYTGALITIILFQGSFFSIALGAIGGGIFAACLVYLLAYKNGIHAFRLIVVGIAISAMLSAFNTWLMITGSLELAHTAALWGAGSLNGISWEKGLPSAMIISLCLCSALLLSRPLSMLEMGHDTATMLGISTERVRKLAMLIGVMLIACVTAATGPIAFISLAAPQLAQRLVGKQTLQVTSSALMGACLLMGSDYLAVSLFAPIQLPVGVITVSIGGLYLVWLLVRETSRGKI